MTTAGAMEQDPPGRLTLRGLLALAVAFGLAAGFAELGLLGVEKFALGRMITRSRDVVWAMPLWYAGLFATVALVAALAGQVLRRPPSLRAAVIVFGTLAGFSVLLLYDPRLHALAALLLSAGAAFQLSRWAAVRPSAALALARRAAVGLGLALAAIMAGTLGGRRAVEAWRVGHLPRAEARLPNILLIILDTVRAPNLSAYGYPRPTSPALEKLSGRGVRFAWAVSSAPWTTPTHATLFTGHYTARHGADWRSAMTDSLPTLAGVLAEAGYRTAGFTANKVHAGWEFGLARDFHRFSDYRVTLAEVTHNTSLGRYVSRHRRLRRLLDARDILGRKSADVVSGELLAWLDEDPGAGRPFFAFLNYYDAHQPYLPPEPFAGQFDASRPPLSLRRRLRAALRPGWVRPSEDAYDAAIAYIDDRLGRLFAALEQRGLLQHTVVVVTADHGEEFGEHGDFGHGNNLYFPNLHVPLIVAGPGSPAGRVVTTPVSLRDLPATLLDLAGVPGGRLPGVSLARHWADGAAEAGGPPLSEVSGLPEKPKDAPVSRGSMVAVLRDSLHLIQNGDGALELFDVRRDPDEQTDLAARRPAGASLGQLDSLLDSLSAARAP